MATALLEPIAAHFAAKNRRHTDASLASFAETAIIEDEGPARRGPAAIRDLAGRKISRLEILS